jgi:ATP-dependent protease Clp ATPase subunit
MIDRAASDPLCSFCGKPQHAVMQLIAGPRGFICDECVMLATEMIGVQHREWRERLTRVLALLPDRA